ncbi:MAG: hypothetical protein UV26_C0030G0010 [candidate division WWE3 bacterium GW2011_GWF2_42_42]|uniref:Uncharacterized protein n=1 Tax=candidate division WWE3 bacterium GW2011_GWF2_42_42 TaxID=1619142 RepID=A0A0G1DAC6_UNCKA|nr:MAG: hypothetical protein UV26_C0030G0010 [candidate division WWE3 bacterium GW2011_GWF2_42_42]
MTKTQIDKLLGLDFSNWEIELLQAMRKNIAVNITSVSKSGMSRKMKFYTVSKGKIVWCTFVMGKVLQMKLTERDEELTVNGCGMDMVFHILTNFNYRFSKILTGEQTKNYSQYWVDANSYTTL